MQYSGLRIMQKLLALCLSAAAAVAMVCHISDSSSASAASPAIERLFFGGTGGVYSVNLEGSDLAYLVNTGNKNVFSVDVDVINKKLYWFVPNSDSGVYRANLDGSHIELAVNGIEHIGSLAVDPLKAKIYMFEDTPSGDFVRRSNLDGTELEILSPRTSLDHIRIDWQSEKVYFSANNFPVGNFTTIYRHIFRTDLNFTTFENIAGWTLQNPVSPDQIALDIPRDELYWAEDTFGSIQRTNLSTSQTEVLLRNLPHVNGLAVHSATKKLYWTSGRELYRANLDGSEVEVLASGLPSPSEIVFGPVIPEPSSLVLLGIGPLLCFHRMPRPIRRRRRVAGCSN